MTHNGIHIEEEVSYDTEDNSVTSYLHLSLGKEEVRMDMKELRYFIEDLQKILKG